MDAFLSLSHSSNMACFTHPLFCSLMLMLSVYHSFGQMQQIYTNKLESHIKAYFVRERLYNVRDTLTHIITACLTRSLLCKTDKNREWPSQFTVQPAEMFRSEPVCYVFRELSGIQLSVHCNVPTNYILLRINDEVYARLCLAFNRFFLTNTRFCFRIMRPRVASAAVMLSTSYH